MTARRVIISVAFAGLLVVTVLVFRGFDRHSHSASDTLRPFLLTMVPAWLAAGVAARSLLRRTGV